MDDKAKDDVTLTEIDRRLDAVEGRVNQQQKVVGDLLVHIVESIRDLDRKLPRGRLPE